MPSRWLGLVVGAFVMGGAWLALAELGFQDTIHVQTYQAWVALAALGGGLGWFGRLRWPLTLCGATFALLFVVQWLPWPASLARGMVRTDSLPATGVDAIVVLSASMTDDGTLSPTAASRLLEGARLYRAGVAPRLAVSRIVRFDGADRPFDSDQSQLALLQAAGVAPELKVLSPVENTHVEAVRMTEWAQPKGWRRIVVVTSPIHTRRACAAFEAQGFEVTCRPSPEREFSLRVMGAGSDRSRAFGQWLYEFLGWWEYRARGWVRG